ncbi:MAG: hydrogenase maturation protease [Actinomycetota bacterium]|jgi:hydrogenase maturation protease|nr:hydrogenase maturation protease [Actinomycetota bacterium]
MTNGVLVAGVGNIFLGDDAWGLEVVRRLNQAALPSDVRVEDFGIRGVHLAYEILNGYDKVILVDAAAQGETPGTVSVIEIDPKATAATSDDFGETGAGVMDAHRMDPASVVALVGSLGGEVGRMLLVACEPEAVEEGAELTPAVLEAVDKGVETVRELIEEDGDSGALAGSPVSEEPDLEVG